MKAELCSVFILLSVLIINTDQQQICSNGVFKCVSPVSLRICFLDKLVTSEFFCPNSTFCNEKSPTICTKIPVALPAIQYYEESTTIDAETYPDYLEIQCTEPGIIAVENTGCTTYLNCSNSETVQESTCDEVSLFNPKTKTCNEDYICPETLDYVQSDDYCSETSDTFICTKVGNFPMPNTNCLKYIYCKQIYIGLKAIQKFCPKNTLFDPLLGKCTQEYVCKDECGTTSASITTTTVQETTFDDSPKCPGIGKFPVPNTNCTTFRLCINTTHGISYKDYVCPSGSYYNPDKKTCSTNYQCWPQITTTSPDPNLTDLPVDNSTLDDFTQNSTPDDTTQNSTSDGSTPNSTPDDSTPNSTPDDSTPNSTPDSSTPDSTNDITIPSTSIITEKDITDDLPSNSTKDPDSSITTSNDFTENSTDAQITTTFSNPVTTQDSSLNITDLFSTTENTAPYTTDDSFSTTDKADSTTSELITDDAKPNITTSFTTEYFTENTDYTDETSSHSTDTETTTSSNTVDDDNENTTPTIDCRNQGRLPVLNTKCRMYYQCTLTTSGYRYMVYECSEGTLYDPYKKICSNFYTCPEIIVSTTTDKSEPDASTTTIDYTVSDSDESSEDIELNCTQPGKIPIPNTDCLLYGQCTLTTSGFIQNIYECPKDSLYDPEMKLCSTSYVCPEIIPDEPTTDNAITTTTMDHPSTKPNELSSVSTINPEIPSPIIPSCTEQGKFPILNTNCKSYISCLLTTNGFITNKYICSGNLLFDPNLKKCSSNYICQEDIAQFPKNHEVQTTKEDENKLTTIELDFEKCTESGRFPISQSKCSQFIVCSSTATGFKYKIYTCPINSFYDPEHKRCSQTYSCSELDTTTETSLSTISTDLDVPECHQNGKFSVNNTGCTKYILCSFTSTGFKSKIYTCPEDSFFNPEMKRCQKEYICPELSTDLQTTTEISDLEESSEECVNADVLKEIPVCTKTGKFPISGTNCKQYILCTQTSLGFRSKIYDCPNDSNFDPNKSKCMLSYNCTEKICLTKAIKLIRKPIITKCKSPGKFTIKGTHCKKFKLCVWTNLSYTKTVYDCPDGTYFDPRLQSCSENYICAEDISYNCTTIGQFKDLSDTTCQYYISCKANSDGIVRGERKICPRDYYFDPIIQKCSAYYMCKNKFARTIEISPKFLVNGQCTTVGRYAITGTNCKNYMYCADNGDGTLKGTQFTCPTTTVFNQAIQKCAATYICPDSVCNFLGRVPNPNSKDCTSYIECEDVFDPITGIITGTMGRVVFCPVGQKFYPRGQTCSSIYVCPS